MHSITALRSIISLTILGTLQSCKPHQHNSWSHWQFLALVVMSSNLCESGFVPKMLKRASKGPLLCTTRFVKAYQVSYWVLGMRNLHTNFGFAVRQQCPVTHAIQHFDNLVLLCWKATRIPIFWPLQRPFQTWGSFAQTYLSYNPTVIIIHCATACTSLWVWSHSWIIFGTDIGLITTSFGASFVEIIIFIIYIYHHNYYLYPSIKDNLESLSSTLPTLPAHKDRLWHDIITNCWRPQPIVEEYLNACASNFMNRERNSNKGCSVEHKT